MNNNTAQESITYLVEVCEDHSVPVNEDELFMLYHYTNKTKFTQTNLGIRPFLGDVALPQSLARIAVRHAGLLPPHHFRTIACDL